MNPVRAFQLFLLRVLATGAVAGYLISVLQPSILPHAIRYRPYTYALTVAFVLQGIYGRFIYPKYFHPLRDLPTIKGVSVESFSTATKKKKIAEMGLLMLILYLRSKKKEGK